MARALTAAEQVRYPWASRITDYVPVGRWRKAAVACSGSALAVFVTGCVVEIMASSSVRGGFELTDSLFGSAVILLSYVLVVAGFAVGAVTAVTAAVRRAWRLLVWSVLAMALPALEIVALWLVAGLLTVV